MNHSVEFRNININNRTHASLQQALQQEALEGLWHSGALRGVLRHESDGANNGEEKEDGSDAKHETDDESISHAQESDQESSDVTWNDEVDSIIQEMFAVYCNCPLTAIEKEILIVIENYVDGDLIEID